MIQVHFINPGSIDQISGGYIYNKKLVQFLNDDNITVKLFEYEHLNQYKTDEQADIVLVDSLLLFQEPEIALELAKKHSLIGLIHFVPSFVAHSEPCPAETQIISKLPLIVSSNYLKNRIINSFDKSKEIMVVVPGIEPGVQKTTYNKNLKNLIVVSNYVEGKGLLELLEILPQLTSKNWNLEIYGNTTFAPDFVEEVKNKIVELGLDKQVILKEQVSQKDIHQIMSKKDLLIHNSRFESYGMCVHEAVAIGLPVLSTEVGEYESLMNNSLNIFFPYEDQSKLKEHLEKILLSNSPFSQLSTANGNGTISWELSMKKLKKHLIELCQ